MLHFPTISWLLPDSASLCLSSSSGHPYLGTQFSWAWRRKSTCGENFNNHKRANTIVNLYAWFGDYSFRVLDKSHPNSVILTTGEGVHSMSDCNAEHWAICTLSLLSCHWHSLNKQEFVKLWPFGAMLIGVQSL